MKMRKDKKQIMSMRVRDKVLKSKVKKQKLVEEEKESQISFIATYFLPAKKQKAI